MYNFENELVNYCKSDLELLRQGVVSFGELIKENCKGIDPFQVSCTAPSACNYIYRQLFMPPSSIGILPINGYCSLDRTSFPANQWLLWMEKRVRTENPAMKFKMYKSAALSNNENNKIGEQKIGPCRVDGLLLQRPAVEKGWVASAEKVYAAIIYEFFGCFYHGCYVCYPNRKEFNKKLGMTMEELQFTTFQERFRFLQKQVDEKLTHRTTDGPYFRIESCKNVWEC